MSLKTGAELICIFTVFNKASGLYGLLALLTGAPISSWQLSMYLYSVLAAFVIGFSLRYIQHPETSGLEILSFAWFFLLDTLINLGYTALFATSWFLVLSQSSSPGKAADAISDSAGFTSPKHTVSSVIVSPTQVPGHAPGTGLMGVPADSVPALGESVLHPEQIPSLLALIAILLVKAYFILIVFSFARQVVRVTEESKGPTPYVGGWSELAYKWLSRGSYWHPASDLRLSKTRSQARDT